MKDTLRIVKKPTKENATGTVYRLQNLYQFQTIAKKFV
jgi:hypothetical protein